MKFEILSRIKSVFKDMSAFKTFRNIKTGVYQSEIGDNFGFLSHAGPALSQRKVGGPKKMVQNRLSSDIYNNFRTKCLRNC